MKPVARKDGEGVVRRLCRDDEALPFASLPVVNQVAMSARALVAKVTGRNPFAFAHEDDPVGIHHLAPADGFTTAVPHAEDDPPLGLAVDLHAEVTAVPPA